MMSADPAAGQRPMSGPVQSSDPIAAFCDTLALAQQVTNGLASQGFEPVQLSI